MRVLAVNCGSSTLKFRVVNVADGDAPGTPLPWTADGLVERIGSGASVLSMSDPDGGYRKDDRPIADHRGAMEAALALLQDAGQLDGLMAVGHRVVHGGDRFVAPTVVEGAVGAELERVSELAPLHNRPALDAMHAAGQILGPGHPTVAVFDTAYHHDMPARAARYAIPAELVDRYGIRRFGFHGLAHRWMAERYVARTGSDASSTRLITLQLGSGCSAAAVAGGRSIDTTMGLTPLEGLVMGTRSGDVDPALVPFLAERERVDAEAVLDRLNHASGLLGVSGRSADVRDLLAAERSGDQRAGLALEMFCYRIRKCIGAYGAALGGADAVVFGGGIGEHSPEVRARVCTGLENLGIVLDTVRNQAAVGVEATVSADGSLVGVEVLPVEEATIIARDTARTLA
jgi:acetate kinase